jgi:hypothetical protein
MDDPASRYRGRNRNQFGSVQPGERNRSLLPDLHPDVRIKRNLQGNARPPNMPYTPIKSNRGGPDRKNVYTRE